MSTDLSDLIKAPVEFSDYEEGEIREIIRALIATREICPSSQTGFSFSPEIRDLLILVLSAGTQAIRAGVVVPTIEE